MPVPQPGAGTAALRSHERRPGAGGVGRDLQFAEPDAGVRAAVDQAYRNTYARYGETSVVPVVRYDAVAATFRLIPH